MSPRSPIVPFRANEQDRERLEYLKKKGKPAAEVIRKGIEMVFEAEKPKTK